MSGSSLRSRADRRTFSHRCKASRWSAAVLSAAIAGGALITGVCLPVSTAIAAEPMTPDQQSAQLLNAGRRAYNDRNFTQAVNQFREITQKFAGGKDAPAAFYGLGLSLLDGPKDYAAAGDALKQAVAAKDSPDYPQACYFYGVAMRGLGSAELKQASEKPAPQGEPLRTSSNAHFAQAADLFGQCVTALAGVAKDATDDHHKEAADWTARAQCDQGDCLLRAGKAKDVEAVLRPVLDNKDPAIIAKYRPLAVYHLGHARFELKEYKTAGRALIQLAPFDQEFGPHARFLLARIHHLDGDRTEAETQYKAILTGYEQYRKTAQQQLQQERDKATPERRAFLESIATGGVPDYVKRASFYQAVLLADEGKFADAKELLVKFYMENKDHPLAGEARLRAGFCQIQNKQFPEAIATLTPMIADEKLGDQATWLLGKAQIAAADQSKSEAVEAAAKSAMESFHKAADRAAQLAATDPAAKLRRADILLDWADAQLAAKQYREASGTYLAIVNENVSPQRAEEASQRNVTALHLSADYAASDAAALAFEQKFPKSTLLPAVLFRSAENAYLTAVAAAEKGAPKPELQKQFDTAIVRYQRLVKAFPEFPYVNAARQGIALSYYKLGKYEQALTVLAEIPDAERTGELATVPYLQADALIRTFPPETEDALTATNLIDIAERAGKMMETFAASNPKSPLVPDALLKQGYCYERMASLLAEKAERDKSLQTARETFEKHLKQYANDPSAASVYLERAKTMALQGDVGGAMNELRRFQNDPLKSSPAAPLAILKLASLMRSQGQAKEAADLLTKLRAEQEPALAADPARANIVPLLQYEHALAIKETGKLADARKMFDEIAVKNPGKPEAVNAAWRSVQCRREEFSKQLSEARQKLNQPGISVADAAAPTKAIAEVGPALALAIAPLNAMSDKLTAEKAPAELIQRVLYELAWCDRTIGDAESELARQKARQDSLARIVAKLPKPPAGQTPKPILAPDVLLSTIPIQPGEAQAKERYKKLIAAGPDRPLAIRARFELAELVADRGDYDGAIEELNGALLAGAPQDLAERIRLRQAACFLGKGDGKTALAAVKPIVDAAKPNQPPEKQQLVGEARFIQGEAAIQQQDWKAAIALLAPFRDQDVLRNIPGVSDRALLRLGQAYAKAEQWQPSQQAFDAVVNRFPQSPFVEEARFGVGFAMQNQNKLDDAINVYTDVTRRTAAEVAARAQVHIGLARIAQKKYAEATTALLAVPYTYDYPEWSAAACYEAARAYKEMQKPQEAANLWRKVIQDYPSTKSAALAKAKLDEIK